MQGRFLYKLVLLAGTATLLQGCVAAVVPLAAGGLMGTAGGRDGDEDSTVVETAAVDPTVIVNPSDEQTTLAADENGAGSRTATVQAGPAPQPATAAEPETIEQSAQMTTLPAPQATTPSVSNDQIAQSVEITPSTTESVMSVAESQTATEQLESSTVQVVEAAAPPRRISVDTGVAFAEDTPAAPAVSAAEAAAALAETAPEPALQEPAALALADATSSVEQSAAIIAPGSAEAAVRETVFEQATSTEQPSSTSPAPAAAVADVNGITALISYASQRKFEFTPGQSRTSAVLLDRVQLGPERADCVGIRPTVLIDLDPEGGSFSPDTASRPPAGLATGLARLRSAGVAIAWVSSAPATLNEAYRDALARSGLDERGTDQLLLMRGDADRKQIRREQIAQTSCLVAIAGDTRSDFDELYDYLLNPSDADVLEPLIGEGWFLIPTPLLSEGPDQ